MIEVFKVGCFGYMLVISGSWLIANINADLDFIELRMQIKIRKKMLSVVNTIMILWEKKWMLTSSLPWWASDKLILFITNTSFIKAIKNEKWLQEIKHQWWMAWQVHSIRGYLSSVERYAEYHERSSVGHQSAVDPFSTDCYQRWQQPLNST